MSSLFAVLFLLSSLLLIWGLIAPHHFAKRTKSGRFTRKHAGIGFGPLVVLFLILVGVTAPSSKPTANLNITPAKSQTQERAQSQSTEDAVTTKQVTETQPIPYATTDQNDSGLAKSQTKVAQVGKNGEETLTYTVTYTDGVQTDKTLSNTTVNTPAVNQIVDVGTYVAPTPVATGDDTGCTNGTYINSAGNTVCSPESSSTVPAGATAQCVDGTYSFSQSHSGTCSHHGGVAQWLD